MNLTTVHYLNLFLGSGTIALQVFIVLTLIILFGRSKNKKNSFLDFVNEHFLVLSFFLALFSSVFPLVYSEIVGFLPCVLCWWQRVFMIPLLPMFAVALWDKDRRVLRYALPLAVIGFLISLYQNFSYYFTDTAGKPCDASGVSCYQLLIPEFSGYVQIPLMALTAFAGMLTLMAVAHFYKKGE